MKKSTHQLIQGPWQGIKREEDENEPKDTVINDVEDYTGIQDSPQRGPEKLSLRGQMEKYMYPDVTEEQV